LRGSTDLFRYSCSLGLGISGNAAVSFLQLPADIFGGSADTIFVHDSSFAPESRGQCDRGFRWRLGRVDFEGRHWAPVKEVRPTEQSSACFKDFHGLDWSLFRHSGFPPDDAAFDESVPTKHGVTDSEKRSAPKPEMEKAALVSFGYDLSGTHMVLFLSYL
jgi:hypothetical protein